MDMNLRRKITSALLLSSQPQLMILKERGLSSKSTADAISEAERLFDLYFQDLVNVAKTRTNRIHILRHQKKIGERGLTDYDSFEKHIKENLANSILGTSGCGKTRLCFEALCQNYAYT
ncbi:unnamed protein product [Rhizophagus irregularis]|nr:unnamed protein product [Rhizophagus irregularis]